MTMLNEEEKDNNISPKCVNELNISGAALADPSPAPLLVGLSALRGDF